MQRLAVGPASPRGGNHHDGGEVSAGVARADDAGVRRRTRPRGWAGPRPRRRRRQLGELEAAAARRSSDPTAMSTKQVTCRSVRGAASPSSRAPLRRARETSRSGAVGSGSPEVWPGRGRCPGPGGVRRSPRGRCAGAAARLERRALAGRAGWEVGLETWGEAAAVQPGGRGGRL